MFIINNIATKVTLILLGVTLLFSCENDMQRIKAITDAEEFPTVSAKNIETSYTSDGKLTIQLFSKRLNKFQMAKVPYTEFPEGLKVLFYDDEGKVESSLTANYAKYFEEKQLWEARGDVEMVNKEGDILNTELMYANENTEKMYTDQYVKITMGDGTKISGERGFISNFDFTEYSFRGVSGLINVEE